MMFIEFPIAGSFRFVLIIMESIFTFFSFELGIIFLIKYKKQQINLKNSQDLGFASLFFGFSILRLFLLISSYYLANNTVSPFLIWVEGSYRRLFLNFGFFSIILGTLLFSFYMEKYKKFLFRKYFFTGCFIIILLLFLILFFIDLEFFNSLSILSWPLFILFFMIYIKDFGRKSKKQEILSKGFLKMTITLLLILIGYIFSMDLIIEIFGLLFRFVGMIFQLIAIGLIFIFFKNIPPFFEFDWQDKIESIYILNKTGICLFAYSFSNKTENLETQFISGALASMNIMLNELIQSKSEEISIIRKKGKIVILFSGNYITGVLICKEELKYFIHNLKNLILRVEEIYENILIKWNGDLTIFYPIKNIIDEIFST